MQQEKTPLNFGIKILDKENYYSYSGKIGIKRLPNKILDICGEPMIKRVRDRVKKLILIVHYFFVLIQIKLKIYVLDGAIKLLKHQKLLIRTERIASVTTEIISKSWDVNFNKLGHKEKDNILKNSFIINIQGDQPFINKELVNQCIKEILNNSDNQIITPVFPLNRKDIHNPNVVKVLLNKENKAIYFSRSAVPYIRDIPKDNWHEYFNFWGHIGIYCYRADFLKNFSSVPKSDLEELEKLEQLRFIDSGYPIHIFKTEQKAISIDEISDLIKAREITRINLTENNL